jgi:hypothetical protein
MLVRRAEREGSMPGDSADKFDFFLSRRGSVAAVAREVADVLTERGYAVFIHDYDIALGASFFEATHEAIKNARDLIVLFTRDYEESPYTRKEFTSFEAERLQDARDRHMVVLRCEDAPLRGLLADTVYQDLVGVTDPEERKRRIIAAAERRSSAQRPQRRRGRTFVGVPPRTAGFTGRAEELDRLDAVLVQDRPAAVTQVGWAADRCGSRARHSYIADAGEARFRERRLPDCRGRHSEKSVRRNPAADRRIAAAAAPVDGVKRALVARSVKTAGDLRLDERNSAFVGAQPRGGPPRNVSASHAERRRLPRPGCWRSLTLGQAAIWGT